MMEGGRRRPQARRGRKEDCGPIFAGMKKQAAAAQANVDRLAAEEVQLTQDLAAEQARWIDINQRLDELERALAEALISFQLPASGFRLPAELTELQTLGGCRTA